MILMFGDALIAERLNTSGINAYNFDVCVIMDRTFGS